MYVARLTRPDILLPVTYLASRSHTPKMGDVIKIGRVLRYLKGTLHRPLIIKCKQLTLHCHCDASYGTHSDGKSHTGYVIMADKNNPSLVSARSIKQKTTAISSTDAEIIALTTATTTCIWLLNLYQELAVNHNRLPPQESILTFQDNKSAIWMVAEPTRYKRSKHILIKTSFIKEHVQNGTLNLHYMSTDLILADFLTKPKQGQPHSEAVDQILGSWTNKSKNNKEQSKKRASELISS